jgi:hypothetical protein
MMNSMQMPQQPQPVQGAGLGAMLQAKGSSTGVSKQSMDQMMARARDLPDSELADVLAGKSMAVPQFAAMLAAMGRQSLRTAVAGAQAGAAKAPSKKDQVLAAMQPDQAAGLSALPAQNMEQLGEGMADGGIVAFSGERGSSVEDPDSDGRRLTSERFFRGLKDFFITDPSKSRWKQAIEDAATPGPTSAEAAARTSFADTPFSPEGYKYPAYNIPRKFGSGAYGAPSSSISANPASSSFPSGMIDASTLPGRSSILAPTEPSAASPSSSEGPASSTAPKGTGPQGPGIGAPPAAGKFDAPPARKSPIDELTAPLDEIRKQVASGKEQAQGEFLMTLGARIMRTPNLGAAIGQGIQEGLPGLAANRKEANALLKDQRDYNLNLSKAKEAAAQGRDDLAFKYADLAEKAQYHAGMVGAYMARASGGNTFGPKQYQAAMSNAQKEVDAYISKLGPLEKRKLTPETRQQLLETAFNRNMQAYQSGVMPTMPDPRVVSEIPKGGNILSRD